MKLLDEIVELASGEAGSVATLLRKCLVLAHTLKSERLKTWADKELNGYAQSDEIPEYRKTPATAKGLFVGPFGAQIKNQPLPSAVLKKEHRHFTDSAILFQPIAAYQNVGGKSSFMIEWPPDLTMYYQKAFIEHYVLNRAWQEIPGSVFVGLIDTIKTRVLRFALELRDDLGVVSDNLNEVPKEKIDQSITMNIFGGNNVIASQDVTYIHTIEVGEGDWAALMKALQSLGVGTSEIAELQSALEEDCKDDSKPGLGQRAAIWLKQLGSKLGTAGLAVGIEVAKTEATKWIQQYLGRPPS
jgi:hypothetical protein